MPFLPSPLLPSAADLAARAALLSVPAILWTLGHDLTIHSVAGQLLPLSGAEAGQYLLDRPIPQPARRTLIGAAIGALVGQVETYEVEAHGRRWATRLEPILDPTEPDPHRRILGALGTSTLCDVPALEPPDPDLIGSYQALASDGELHRGDVVTVRRGSGAMHHARMTLQRFDRLLASGLLTPCHLSADASDARPRRSGGGSARRHLVLA